MIADEVQHHQVLLSFAAPQTAPQLLQEEDLGLGGPQHHDRVDAGQVDALVKQVN